MSAPDLDRLNLLLSLNRAAEGEKAAREAIAGNPEWANGYTFLALFLLNQGRPRDARAPARDGVAKAPLDPWAHVCQALVLDRLGRHDAAVDAVREALRISPEYAYAHRVRAQVLSNDQRYIQAVRAAQEGLRHHPDDESLLYALGWAEYRLGNRKRALEVADHGLRINPLSGQLLNLRGCAEWTAAEKKSLVFRWLTHRRSEVALAAAVRVDPGESAYRDNMNSNALAWRSDQMTAVLIPILFVIAATVVGAKVLGPPQPVALVPTAVAGVACVGALVGLGYKLHPLVLTAPLGWFGVPEYPLPAGERRLGRRLWRAVFAGILGGLAVAWVVILAYRFG